MSWQEVLSVGASIIASLGGAGFVIFALSGWLGKIWAERIMAADRATHATELEKLRADLQRENHRDLESLKAELSISQQRDFKGFQDKLAIYRMVVDLLSDFLHDLAVFFHTGQPIPDEKIKAFDKLRMKTFGYLGMLAPQDVMDAHEELIERVIETLEGSREFNWQEIREKVLLLLNAARVDIGLNPSPIVYNGNR